MTIPDIGSQSVPAAELFETTPAPVADSDLRARIRAANEASGSWTIVLDDDPTGSQSVQGIPVLTRWEAEDLRWAFTRPTRGFFILTNTRGLNADDARTVIIEVASAIERASVEAGARYTLITRSDSTLRGHFPLETDVLTALAASASVPYDVLLIAPAYLAAGRVTAGDLHYVRVGESFVPVGLTNYALDATFGFASSNLRDYVEEKTNGRISSGEVVSIGLDDIRLGGIDRVRDIILAGRNVATVVVNALDESDLDVVVLGLIAAEDAGSRVLSRTGPSFVAARLGLEKRPPLAHADVFPSGDRDGHGLIVVGSHVELTTHQVDRLVVDFPDIKLVELDVPRLLDEAEATAELARAARALRDALEHSDTMLVSSRQHIVGDSGHSSLVIAQTVSAALASLTASVVREMPVSWVLAKGGITSSDVATAGLGIRRATVAGQLFPGIVSVWVHEGGEANDLAGLPYVVFAGNVGDESTLADAVRILRGESL